MGKELNRHFSKDKKMTNKHMRRGSVSLVNREIQMRYHLMPIRTATIKKENINVSKDVKKLEPLCTVSGNGKWCSHCEKQHGNSSTLNTEFVSDPEIPLLGIDPEEVKTATQNRLFIHPCL